MKRDLQIAREIQMWLLPVNPPQVPGMEIGWLRGRSVNTTAPRRAMESAAVRQSPNPSTTAGAISEKTKPRVLNTVAHQARRKRTAVSVASAGSLPPDGFRTLMYCDQLSCAEAMEIIRVQLPTSIAGLTPASTTTNDVVFADVLVGPDGIARGIRIVE